MAKVRYLDQVPVGVYNTSGGGGGTGTVDVYYTGSLLKASAPFINFTGSVEAFTEIISSTEGVTIYVTGSSGAGFPFSGSAVITGSLVVSGSAEPIIIQGIPYNSSPDFFLTYNTESGLFSYSSGSIKYVSGSTDDEYILTRIKVNDYDDNVATTYSSGLLTFTFGTPELPSSLAASFNGSFLTNRFNQELDNYTVTGTWNNGGYTLISASLYTGSTLLTEVGTGTSLTYNTTTSGSQQYILSYTASSPLDGSLYTGSTTLNGTLSKTQPNNPTISSTPTVQLGGTSFQIEQGATGSISFTAAYGSANGWTETGLVTTPSTSPIYVTGSATGSTSISITGVASYESPTGLNIPTVTTNRNASTITYSKIISVRYGASVTGSFTEDQLADVALWDTSLGGTVGTIDKGNTNPNGDTLSITWTGDKYLYFVYNDSLNDLTSLTTGGFQVIGQFTKSVVGNYKIYRTTVLNSGGAGTTQTYVLTI